MTLPLRTRLAASSTVVFGLLLAVLGTVSYKLLSRQIDTDATDRLMALTAGLHGYLRFEGSEVSVVFDPLDGDEATFVHEATHFYQVYDADTGVLLVESDAMAPLALRLTTGEVLSAVGETRVFDVETEYGRLRLASGIEVAAGGRRYLVQVALSLATYDATLARYRDMLLWLLPVMILGSGTVSWWFSAFALAPLSRMALAARDISVEALDERIPHRGVGDELDQLAESFNATLERLERSVGEMRQFSGALAHELRTPLAALRGQIELSLRAPDTRPSYRESIASQLEDIDRLTRLVDQVLVLARAESGQLRLDEDEVDLATLVRSLVEQLAPLAEARSIDLSCAVSGVTTVRGDAGWLRRMVINLVDNALKFTREHGRVMVRLSCEGDRARLEVEDTGIGMAPSDVKRVFERFFQADPARSSSAGGAGLGLALVQWIATRHRGTVSVSSRLGAGSTFTVHLPLLARAD